MIKETKVIIYKDNKSKQIYKNQKKIDVMSSETNRDPSWHLSEKLQTKNKGCFFFCFRRRVVYTSPECTSCISSSSKDKNIQKSISWGFSPTLNVL